MSETQTRDTYPTPPQGWVCFHCGDHFAPDFSGMRRARQHFGTTPDYEPGCVMQLGDTGGLLRRLRAAEDEVRRLRHDLQEEIGLAEVYRARLRSELRGFKPFNHCDSVFDAFNVYDCTEGQLLAMREHLDKTFSALCMVAPPGYIDRSEEWDTIRRALGIQVPEDR